MTKKLLASVSTIIAVLIFSTTFGFCATDIFLKIDGVDGESTDSNHVGWCDCISFEQGIRAQPGVAVACFKPLTIVKYVDRASPKIYDYINKGKTIETVQIDLWNPGSPGYQYLIIELREAQVISVAPSVESSFGRAIETVSFSFSDITWTYTPYQGSPMESSATVLDSCSDCQPLCGPLVIQ